MSHDIDPVAVLLDALTDSSDEQLERLRLVLTDDVRGVGLFVSAEGPDAFVAAVRDAPVPVLAMAAYGPPEEDGDDVVIAGTLPPGLPLQSVRLTVRLRDEQICELVQEVVPAAPPAEVGMEIDEATAAFIDSAFERSAPFVLAYVDEHGVPHLSYRGTVQTHGSDAVALWVRDPRGGLVKAIGTNPNVALLASDHSTRSHYEIIGRARLVDDAEERRQIFERSAEHERNVDPAQRGVAVVVDVDVLRGGPMGAGVHRRRVAADGN
jgi:general stress protein 26